VVMLGVILTVSATSAEVPTEFTTEEIESLFVNVCGAMYLIVIVLVIIISVVIIALFEKIYPLEKTEPEMLKEEPQGGSGEKITFAQIGKSETGRESTTAGHRI